MSKGRKYNKITLNEVAAAADVSPITVSRALREPERVSPEVRERVRAAVDQLGYVPNMAARALASRRTNVLGVLIPSITNNVFSDVLQGIYGVIDRTPYFVQLGNTRYSTLEEEKLLRIFLSQRPAGLVVSGIDQSPASRAMLENGGCPVVQIMEIGEDPVDMMIGFSHRNAARDAVRHLLGQGYRRIGFIGARMDPRTQRRLAGYRDALMEAGLLDEGLIATTTYPSSVGLGAQMLADLIARRPDVDAVFCNNDDLAVGVLFESQRRRIDVPSALGICGFNDFEIMGAANPGLTSVRTNRGEMGRRAVQMLLDALDDRPPREKVVDLGYSVVMRPSTARSGTIVRS